MTMDVAMTMGLIIAFICTILSLIFITPESRKAYLSKFFQFVHDLFNFKFLILEKILKTLYIFSTLYVLFTGVFLLFSVTYRAYGYVGDSTAGIGLALIVFGPILIRVVYEAIMISIINVKNVIEINKKLNGKNDNAPEFGAGKYSLKNINIMPKSMSSQPQQAAQPQNFVQTPVQAPAQTPVQAAVQTPVQTAPQPDFAYCTKCGTKYDKNTGGCPNCNN